MFWTLTVRRLADAVAGGLPKRFGARPDLETGKRMVAVATEGGIVVTVSDPPPLGGRAAPQPAPAPQPRFRSSVGAPPH
jgi:hypothetical protein